MSKLAILEEEVKVTKTKFKKRQFFKINCCVCGAEYEVIHRTPTSKCWDCIQKRQRETAGTGRKHTFDLGGI